MSIINETLKVLNTVDGVTNRLLGMHIGDRHGSEFSNVSLLLRKPLGLFAKSYGFMVDNLSRNAGNGDFTFDGYGIPIGEAVNPYYSSYSRIPWFISDMNKKRTSNYLEYFRNTYGPNISVENINNVGDFTLTSFEARVGRIDTAFLKDAIYDNSQVVLGFTHNSEGNINGIGFRRYDDGNGFAITNPNSYHSDTELGWMNANHLVNTLRNAIVMNDEHKTYDYAITEGLGDLFGMNTKAITNNDILGISYRRSTDTGRFEDLNSLNNLNSPVYTSNYGKYKDLGIYEDFYLSTPTKTTRGFISDSIYRNKYHPSIEKNTEYSTYLDKLFDVDWDTIDNMSIRYIFKTNDVHSNIAGDGMLNTYGEMEGSAPKDFTVSANRGIRFGVTTSFDSKLTVDDLLKKTNDAFRDGRYKTMISRFESGKESVSSFDIKETAYTKEHGLSHGRNLLKRNYSAVDPETGYKNPYCRVWTNYHQYGRLRDAIRPFSEEDESIITQGEFYTKYNFSEFSSKARDGFENGRKRLEKYGVLNSKNGLVNITPKHGRENKVDIKNCMFSIENLAWRGVSDKNLERYQVGGLSPEQKGPNGGRIMWFPPYNIKFDENTRAQWNQTDFIGRGESIFTYRNTERRGNLSFQIVIDHPSIIDYWSGKGQSRLNGTSNVSDSDLVNDKEQELLRFFAGCDVLTANPQKNIPRDPKPEPSPRNEPQKSPSTRKITFFVFYPNDYSGMDDDPNDAINYLVNGLGSGYVLNNNKIVDRKTDLKIYYAKTAVSDNTRVGGYEIRPDTTVSVVTSPVCNTTKKDTFISVHTLSFSSQDSSTIQGPDIPLALQKGPEHSSKDWWKCKWYYRCDKNKADEILHKKDSYVDQRSYSFNSLFNDSAIDTILKYNTDISREDLFSLTDIFVGLLGQKAANVLNNPSMPNKPYYDVEKANFVKNNIKNSNGTIEKIICSGFASWDGGTSKKSENSKRNNELALERAKTIEMWLKNNGVTANEWKSTSQHFDDFYKHTDASSDSRKYERRAKVEIFIKTETSELDTNALTSFNTQDNKGDDLTVVDRYVTVNESSFINNVNNTIYNYIDGLSNTRYETDKAINKANAEKRAAAIRFAGQNIASLSMNLKNSIHEGNVNINGIVNSFERFIDNASYANESLSMYDKLKLNANSRYEMGDNVAQFRASDGTVENDVDNSTNGLGKTNGVDNNTRSAERYDNESKFFELLEINEPVLHHKITDKIKYFDPAFHSMSPEGFNARLTFLQQCMRQGPTISSSDNGSVTANNLSFGRPPVCVLRIGDFYHTKIIIDTLNITYDPLVWDLNHEGIGVMPMIANVTLGFSFIGGSSLSGPISRLQNALSFNMYANTEVYDNRSEMVEYDNDGTTITKYSPYYPTID